MSIIGNVRDMGIQNEFDVQVYSCLSHLEIV